MTTTTYRITAKWGSKDFDKAKAALKQAGATYDPDAKTWTLDDDAITENVDRYIRLRPSLQVV